MKENKDNIEKVVVGVFLAAFAVVATAAVVAIHNIQESIDTSDWVNHTHAVIQESDAVLSALHVGETAFRNYIITGDKRDQGAYRGAFGEMVEHLEVAKSLTQRESSPKEKVLKLETLLTHRVQFTRELSQLTDKEGLEGARKKLISDDGSDIRDIQYLVTKLKEEQKVLLVARDKASFAQAQATSWTVKIGVGINFLLFAFAGWLIRDDLAARRRATLALQEANDQLEAKVRERTAELVEANQSLQKQNLERQWANQALSHQLHYSNLIIGGIQDLVFVVSKAQLISRLNPAVLHASQCVSTELVGSPLLKVLEIASELAPDTSSKQPVLTQAMKEGREIQDGHGSLRRKDGQVVKIKFSMVPLRDHDKVVGGIITGRIDPGENHTG